MSHYATIKVNALDNVNAKTLQRAIKRLDKSLSIRMLSSLREKVPAFGCNAVLMKNDIPTTIRMNFQKEEGNRTSLTVAGEFWNTGYNPEQFTADLAKHYNSVKIEDFAKAEHLQPMYRKTDENGDIVMRFRVAG